jgi:glycosyltransferase involved in cell wall biosynthesis
MTENETAAHPVGRLARADLHLHSQHSNRPSEWFLRRIGAPESFMAPRAVYDACKAAGMDYVTISDHNVIEGALELAELPDTFVSCELTTYFPENGCKVHLLVHGITESQFKTLQEAREDIYTLREVVLREAICHSVAHPLFRVNDRLTPEQFEQLLLLFNRFEGLNGSRDPRGGSILRAVFDGLTPETLADLANRHGIAPHGERPWVKTLTGGSDDHGGLYIAGAYTETPPAENVAAFLEHLREGRCQAGGHGGGSVHLANSLYQIAYAYYRERLLGPGQRDGTVLGAMLRKLGGGESPPAAAGKGGGVRAYVRRSIATAVKRHRQRRMHGLEKLLAEEVQSVVRSGDAPRKHPSASPDPERLQTSFRIVQRLAHRFLERGLSECTDGRILDGLQSFSSLGMVALGVAPYLTATASQHKDAAFLETVAARFPSAASLRERPGGMAWITDTLTDVNGVSHTIGTLATMAKQAGRPVTVVASPRVPVAGVPYDLVQFPPLGTFRLPEYESIELSFPPFLEVLNFLEQRQFSTLMISTPGPLGLCALAAAQLLNLKTRGIYHTDFPAMADGATDDPKIGEAARSYMRWFYGRMDKVYAPTQAYVEHLVDLGIRADRIGVLPRGVDLRRFNPKHADRAGWTARNLDPQRFKYLYVGRISRDKNVETLLQAHRAMAASGGGADLVVVGDGPQRAELEERYGSADTVFTGTLHGSELSRVYASADALVFPSRTDTFGNVVLEAHASGLPAIVSDCGGPREIVSTHGSGLVVDTRDPRLLAEAMRRLQCDANLRDSLRSSALRRAEESRWETVLAAL